MCSSDLGITLWGNESYGGVQIEANNPGEENGSTWTYSNDGSIMFPYIASNARTGYGENLKFNRSTNQKIISTASGDSENNTVERLVIAGGDSYYDGTGYPNGEAGDIYLWAGRGFNGGDIKVDAGNSLSDQEGGTVKIRGGSSDSGQGGFVEISSGYGATAGDIRFIAGANEFTISGNTLTLPVGGDIVNSSGVSVISGIKNVITVNTSGNTVLTVSNEVIFCDANAAGGNINLQLPESPPTGKYYTVKHINGVDSVTVQPINAGHGLEWGGAINTGSYATLVVGDIVTWIFDGSSWRIIAG